MKKIIIALTTSVLASSALADVQVELKGVFDFQAAAREQKGLSKDDNLTQNNKNQAFRTKSALRVKASNTTECGIEYGAQVAAKTTTKTGTLSNNGSYIFAESNFGRLEAGSNLGASHNMTVSALDIARATGDDWNAYVSLNPNGYYNGDPETDYSLVYNGYGNENPEGYRKISYYTPKFNGLQLGVSYAPDVSNLGSESMSKKSSTVTLRDALGAETEVRPGLKESVGVAATYEYSLDDGFDVKVGAGYETAKSHARLIDATTKNDTNKVKFNDHKLYNFGAVVNYGNWSLAGSYADAGKSLTNKTYHFGKRNNKMYTAGLGYSQGPVGLSLVYFNNEKFNNKLESYTLGTDYKMAPGFMPYAEVTTFKYRNKGYDTANSMKQVNKKYNGQVYLIGTKVSF